MSPEQPSEDFESAGGPRDLSAMSTVRFLKHLHRQDVELWVEGERLRYSAPEGALTPTLRAELVERKQDVIAFLRQTTAGARADMPPLEPLSRSGPRPLSFAQERLWFFDQYEPRNTAYNIAQGVRLEMPIRPAVLEQVFNEIVRRHAVLRTTFATVDGSPVQVIAPALTLKLPVVDLRGLPESGRQTQARRLVREGAGRPFDLSRGPLLRVTLLSLSDAEHVLLFAIHHIVSDGWSSGILIRELLTLYRAFSRGEPSPLPALPIQYADFADWQRQWLRGEVLEHQLSYWSKQLAGAPPLLRMPTDRPRPSETDYQAGKMTRWCSGALTQKLHDLGQRRGVTAFMMLLAAFNTLLYRWTGQADILIGSPIANRNRAELEGLIGFFANTLVLRSRPSGDSTFPELLDEVRGVTLDAYTHQDLPFEKLIEALDPARSASHTPLFQVMFSLQTAGTTLRSSGLKAKTISTESDKVSFDLIVILDDTPEGLHLYLRYQRALFDETTISRLAVYFQTLLAGIVADPRQRLSELALLPPAEHHQLCREWNDTRSASPSAECLHERFESWARRTPDAPALDFADQRWSYGHLNRRANQLAHHLRTLGVGPEARVGLAMERSPEMVVGILGILKSGGAYLPLDPDYPRERLAFILEDSRARVVVTRERLLATLPEHGGRMVCLDADRGTIAERSAENPGPAVGAENLAYTIYTSGSTGRPKGVEIRHRAVVNFLDAMRRAPGLTARDVLLAVTTLCFDISVLELFLPLATGGRLVMAGRDDIADGARLPELVEACRITVMQATPATWRLLLAAGWQRTPALKILCGGEVLPVPLARDLVARGRAAWNLYGPTETTVWSTAKALRRELALPVSIGRPIANTQAYLLDRRQRPVPMRVPGELYLGGAGLARGYLGRPQLTAERFGPDPLSEVPGSRRYRTGDLVRTLPDGELAFLGRRDHQVKLRGFRIELGEIETVLRRHAGVRESAVLLREDVPGNQRLVAYVVTAPEAEVTARELRDSLAETLPDYMASPALVFLEAMPRTPNGKVDRAALPAPERSAPAAGFVAPGDPTEELVAGIWSAVLGVERLGVHDNFFELGGHSLLATRVVSSLREAFRVELPLPRFFRAPTVAALARIVDELRQTTHGVAAPPIMRRSRDRELPLSFAQQRLWFLDLLHPGSAAYNVAVAVGLTGKVAVAVMERAFNELVRRHEALRTTFAAVAGRPHQVIADELRLRLPVVDLRTLPEKERAREARRRVNAEAQLPFDLRSGPLIRVTLLKRDEHDQVLMVTMHHIVSDGWSMGILQRELTAVYTAFSQGRPSPLPELPVQYADFAHWQKQWLQGEVLDTYVSYWRKQLAGCAELRLPVDRQAPAAPSYRGRGRALRLPEPLIEALKALSREQSATLFMTLLAALQSLLHRDTGQETVVVGTPVANRNRAQIEDLIGFFVNTLVLRGDHAGNPSFRELLARVREVALGAYDHQDLPFEHLVKVLHPERDSEFRPLYQVMFAFQEAAEQNGRLADLRMSALNLPADGPAEGEIRDHLVLNLFEREGGVAGALSYNAELFDDSTMARFARRFRILLEGMADEPEQRVGDAALLSAAERHQLVVEWSGGWIREDGSSPLDPLWERPPQPLADLKIRLQDAYFQPVPIGVLGELTLSGPPTGIHRTTVRARYLRDGALEVPGTIPRQIRRSGARPQPEEQPVPVAPESNPSRGQDALVQRRAELAQRRSGLSAAKRELLNRHLRGKLSGSPDKPTAPLRRPGGPQARSPIVELKPTGRKPPFFCVHPIGGTVFCYEALAHCLDSEQPFYALQAPGIDGEEEPCRDVRDMASRYVAAVKAVRPRGPYLLGGWSFGGTVAFEMAQQLHRQGAEIALLALIESLPPVRHEENPEPEEVRLLYHFLRHLEGLSGKKSQISYDEVRELDPEKGLPILLALAREHGLLPADVQLEQARRRLNVYRANLYAIGHYHPAIYSGRMALFHSDQLPADVLRHAVGGWSDLASEPIEVHADAVPGDHYTMLTKPHVRVLAQWLEDCIDRSGKARD